MGTMQKPAMITMRNTARLWLLCLVLTACGSDGADTSTAEAPVQSSAPSDASIELHAAARAALIVDAESAIQALAKPLQAQLMAALEAGGPAEAVRICQTVAPALAETVSAEHGLTIRRISLKHRNPDQGKPTDWQRMALETFDAERAGGTPAEALIYVYSADDEFRYLKAIPTGGPCLTCHGDALAPEVAKTLAELYPDDLATGFKEGDVRGAFVVTKALSP